MEQEAQSIQGEEYGAPMAEDETGVGGIHGSESFEPFPPPTIRGVSVPGMGPTTTISIRNR